MAAGTNDHVIDVIASIESHRQRSERDFGLAASCNQALRRLNELLDREREALEVLGHDSPQPVNIETVAAEIARVKKLLGNTPWTMGRSER
jgi:hypothetical protein